MNKRLIHHKNIAVKFTRYGYMTYLVDDLYIGRSLDLYGEYCEDLVRLINKFIKTGATVIDVGANIGAITLPMAKAVGRHGCVLALEPIPSLFNILCSNIALNDLQQIVPLRYASSDDAKVFKLAFGQEKNCGSSTVADRGEEVQAITLDSLNMSTCDFIKIDVEGHEKETINGALDTIGKFRPIMLIENDRNEKSANLINLLFDIDYKLFWCCTKLYSADNFFQNMEDVFGQLYSVDMLALPTNESDLVAIATSLNLIPVASALDRPF